MELLDIDIPEPGIARISFNRPEKLNAFNKTMKRELSEALQDAAAEPDVRVIVLRGNGRAFSAGNDFGGYGDSKPSSVAEDQGRIDEDLQRFLDIWNLPKPVIAEVHGHCLGLATILCICCDMVYVSEDCRIGWPILPIGGGLISPAWAWIVGAHKAKEMSFQPGTTMSGTEAAAMGYANAAVPADQLADHVLSVARNVRRVPAELLRLKKRAINHVFDTQGFQTTLRLGSAWDALLHAAPEIEGLRRRIKDDGISGASAWYRDQVTL